MKKLSRKPFQHRVRVLFHLNERQTRVVLESVGQDWQPEGGPCWDINTDAIPIHLRKIGSRFLLEGISPDLEAPIDEIRTALVDYRVLELSTD